MEMLEDRDVDGGVGSPRPPGGVEPEVAGDRVVLAPRRRTRSLVMWSGGLDSTYALVRLLRETDDEVHAHHVHVNTRRDDGRARARRCEYEAQAVSGLQPRLREGLRPYAYSESRVDLTAFASFARDSAVAMFFAAQAALSLGFTPFDRIVFGVNADEDRRWRPGSELYAFRRTVTIRLLKGIWESEEVPYLFLWDPRPRKREEADYLGAAISALTVSCRDPRARHDGAGVLRPCGSCRKCRIRDALHGDAAASPPAPRCAPSAPEPGPGAGADAA